MDVLVFIIIVIVAIASSAAKKSGKNAKKQPPQKGARRNPDVYKRQGQRATHRRGEPNAIKP